MALNFNTMDDFQFENKTVLIRIDINSPVDPSSGLILDDTRMKLHAESLKELSDSGAKTVILAHQSRPGKKDFTTLKQHANVLGKIIGKPVKYIDDIFGKSAKESIKDLKSGELLLLENVRFYSEEILNRDAEEQSKTHLVQNLSPIIDFFINDAFATAHRSQTSLVGFASEVPSIAGRVMENELTTLYGAIDNVERPCVYVLGGVKVDDSIEVMENVLENGSADFILTSGLVANIFLLASIGHIGKCNEEFIINKGYSNFVDVASRLLDNFSDKILIPIDVAVSDDGKRVDVLVDNIPNLSIFDIGTKTIQEYAKVIRNAKTLFANGPAGVFEDPLFSIGTDDILNSIASSEAFSIIGGGHLAAAAVQMGFEDNMDHISSGGGASINLLAGKDLPVVHILNEFSSKK